MLHKQLDHTPERGPGAADRKIQQAIQWFQVHQPLVSDLRVGQHQALEPNQPRQVSQTRISDPCAGQPESLQLVEPCDGLQSRVGDTGVVYRQRLQ